MKTVNILLLAASFSLFTWKGTHGEKIINGKKVTENSLEYMASVQNNGVHRCGGVLIHPRFVLTAAHCYSSHLSVVLGTHNIDPKRNDLKRYMKETVYIHESYKFDPIYGADIMLLKLSQNVDMNEAVKIIEFSSKDKKVKPNSKCQVAGWGINESRYQVNDLLVADVSTMNITVCKKEWKKVDLVLPDNILCAGGYETKSGACQGDSGGPLVCKGVAVGIVSFNHNRNCNYPNVPNIYTEISAYSDWINKVIEGNA